MRTPWPYGPPAKRWKMQQAEEPPAQCLQRPSHLSHTINMNLLSSMKRWKITLGGGVLCMRTGPTGGHRALMVCVCGNLGKNMHEWPPGGHFVVLWKFPSLFLPHFTAPLTSPGVLGHPLDALDIINAIWQHPCLKCSVALFYFITKTYL